MNLETRFQLARTASTLPDAQLQEILRIPTALWSPAASTVHLDSFESLIRINENGLKARLGSRAYLVSNLAKEEKNKQSDIIYHEIYALGRVFIEEKESLVVFYDLGLYGLLLRQFPMSHVLAA